MPRLRRTRVAIAIVLCLGAAMPAAQAQAVAQAASVRAGASRAPATLRPAPYVRLPRGTQYEYSTFTNRITRSAGWRSWFVDAHGRPGLHVGVFINDDPDKPATISDRDLAALWPLKVGNRVKTRLQRDDGTAESWDIAVSDTQTIQVPLGPVFTYHVRAMQSATVLQRGTEPYTNLYEYWYAPEWGAVVRVAFAGVAGKSQGHTLADQLVYIKRPKR